jgi:hypothetical protein
MDTHLLYGPHEKQELPKVFGLGGRQYLAQVLRDWPSNGHKQLPASCYSNSELLELKRSIRPGSLPFLKYSKLPLAERQPTWIPCLTPALAGYQKP